MKQKKKDQTLVKQVLQNSGAVDMMTMGGAAIAEKTNIQKDEDQKRTLIKKTDRRKNDTGIMEIMIKVTKVGGIQTIGEKRVIVSGTDLHGLPHMTMIVTKGGGVQVIINIIVGVIETVIVIKIGQTVGTKVETIGMTNLTKTKKIENAMEGTRTKIMGKCTLTGMTAHLGYMTALRMKNMRSKLFYTFT